tara:strand:+ start:2178 stop:2654 length:477 start_codon:yes stop_codon:yes gene_type:complete
MEITKNIKNNLHNIIKVKFNKISVLIFLMIFFSFAYMLLDDSHFSGVNKFKEIVKEEVIKDKAKKEIIENFNNFENLNSIEKEEIIDEAAKETEQEVKKEELNPEKVEPSLLNKYFNRLYFAIVTGCLLGYGDIYPVTNISKFISGMQGLFTVALIIY